MKVTLSHAMTTEQYVMLYWEDLRRRKLGENYRNPYTLVNLPQTDKLFTVKVPSDVFKDANGKFRLKPSAVPEPRVMKKYGELHAWEHHINQDNDDVDEDGDNISEKMCKEIASRYHFDLEETVALAMSANAASAARSDESNSLKKQKVKVKQTMKQAARAKSSQQSRLLRAKRKVGSVLEGSQRPVPRKERTL